MNYKKNQNGKQTYGEVYQNWITLHKKTIKESSYIRIHRYFKNYILPSLGNKYIDSIKPADLQTIIDFYAMKLHGYKSIKIYMAKVFNHAIFLELISKNPCDYIVLPRQNYNPLSESMKTGFWSKDDLRKFLRIAEKSMHPMWYCFFRLISFTGIRKCEALALNWEDIDFANRQIVIDKTLYLGENNEIKIDTPKTKNSVRILDIDKKTTNILATWKELQGGDNKILFSNRDKEYITPSYPLKVLKKFIRKYKLKEITIHGLRHTHCSILFEAGASMKEAQLRLGHSDIKTTLNIYTHVSKKKKSELINLYTSYLNEI